MELVDYKNMKLIDYRNEIRYLKRNKKNYDELQETYYRKCFEMFDSVNGDKEELNIISKCEGIASTMIAEYAYYYAIKNLCYTKEDLDAMYNYNFNLDNIKEMKREVIPSTINYLFLDLLTEEDPDKIIDLIQMRYDGDVSRLKIRVSNFVVAYFPSRKDYLISSLRKKIDIYYDYVKEQNEQVQEILEKIYKEKQEKEEQKFYDNTKYLLETYIEGTYDNKQYFCDCFNIKMDYFNQIICLSEKYAPITYQKYKEKIDKQRNRRFAVIISMIYKLIDFIKNGILEEDGSIRQFDIIDYYLFTKIDFDFFLNTINEFNVKLTSEEYKILKTFFAKNKKAIKDNFKDIGKILDSNSIQIVGNRIILLEEKQLIVKYLKDNKIPQNIITYNLCLRKYLDGKISINTKNDVMMRKLVKN